MDPKLIKRGAIVLSIIVVVIVLSVACNTFLNKDYTPVLSNQDDVFMSYDDFDVTNQELYERIKVMDGLSHLQNYIDRQLLSDYIDDVEASEIDEKIKEMTYGTTDDSEIDELSAREKEELVQNYRDTLVMNGYDPDDDDSVETFMRINIAKEHYTREAYLDEDGDFAISDSDLESYYEDYKQGDLQAIMLRFSGAADVNNVLNHFNIVPNFEGGLGLYNPSANDDIPIEDVASDGFDEDNTTALTDEEALSHFIDMYNFIYPYRDALPDDASIEDLVALQREPLMFNQYDMQKAGEGRGGNSILNLSDHLFKTMPEAKTTHSRQARAIGEYRFMFYVLDREDVTPYEELDENTLEDLRAEYVENLIGEQQVNQVMQNLYAEEDLRIHDKMLALTYERQHQNDVYEENEDTSSLATLESFTVNTDDFFDHAAEKVGAMYSLEVLKQKTLLESDYFEDVFGSNRDVFSNNSERMQTLRSHVGSDKSTFNSGAYQQYGFSPEDMTWNEFLFQAYGLTGEEDYLTTLVVETIRNDYLYDQSDFDKVMDYVEEQYNNYFSLQADQLLIFVDMDENFNPDDFNEYYDDMSDAEQTEFDALKASLETEIQSAIDGGDTMKDVVDAYKQASRITDENHDDYSVWAQYKAEGLILKYENLAVSTGQQTQPGQQPQQEENLNYNNTKGYVEEFVKALQDLYEDYETPENEDLDELYASSLTTTQFGIHMIRAEEGENFDKPSAAFENADGTYDAASENDSSMPTVDQVALYSEMRIEKAKQETVGGTGELDFDKMPENLYDDIGTFSSQSYERLFNNINHSIQIIETIRDDASFTQNQDHHMDALITMLELFERRTFPPIEDEFDSE